MYRHFFHIFSILILAFLFIGCSSKMPVKPHIINVTLPDQIPETFNFKIENENTKRLISDLRPDHLNTHQRIEVLSLQGLSKVNKKREVPVIYDRIWETEPELKDLVNAPVVEKENFRSMAIIYYLLVAEDIPSWREKTAASMKKGLLKYVMPEHLTGYPLHFYTFALLKTGQYEDALPFLKQISDYTQPEIYMQDLLIALQFACTAQDEKFSAIFLENLIRHSQKYGLDLPDEQIKQALILINKKDSIKKIREALLPLYKGQIEFQNFAFVIFLEDSVRIAVKKTAPIQEKVPQKPIKKMSPQKIAAKVNIQLIAAGNDSYIIDSELMSIAGQLKNTFLYTEYTLIDDNTLVLYQGEKGTFKTSNDFVISVKPEIVTKEKIDLTLSIEKNGKVVNTFVQSIDGGESFMGGPNENGKKILLRISTWIQSKLK